MHNDIEPSLDLDPAPTKIREERFFTSALDHIRAQPLGRALHWYRWQSCPLTETDYFIFSLGNQLFVVLVVDVDGGTGMSGTLSGLTALAEQAKGTPCLMPMRRVRKTNWKAVEGGWGLIDAHSAKRVEPPDLVSVQPIAMSPWELQAYSNQFLAQQLEDLGYELLPEVSPTIERRAIWFRREQYEPEWVVARPQYGFAKSLLNFVSAKLWSGGTYEARLRRGYIADVTFKDPANEKKQIPGKQLLRGQTYKALITNIRQLRSNDTITPFN